MFKKRMFQPWMMVTNVGIMSGVWTTFVCLITGVI
jgi:hypothetical protein